ncbi:PREDICTED: uncharacterized protein LOC109188421 isoform X1 [Ipomoea nil]|uniref:uncharacterized protein LOC109188421 isoform X1 n=1 Tax=Ipomoea nil TaxID=35883 RepID=UPI000901BE9E|nr:PREDICTED: uncharacterized protein LOC109188421 isoform X1 [Ipomoea nil]
MDPLNSPNPINPQQTKSGENEPATPELSPDSGIKWPCNPSPKRPPTDELGWPTVWFPPKSEPRVLTPEELARLADDQAQQAAWDAVTEFLRNTDIADDDDEEYDDEYVDVIKYENGELDEVLEEEERKRFDFFVNLFKEDSVLKEYYEKNCAGGEFRCLVCCAVREKAWKRFKGCATLVRHSLSIAKTRKRKAHRAYAESICQIFGWDINKFIQSSDKSAEAQGNIDKSGKDGLDLPCDTVDLVKVDTGNEKIKSGSGSEVLEHNSLAEVDTSKHVEVLSGDVQDAETVNAERSPNGPEPANVHCDVAHGKDHQEDNVPNDLKEDGVQN